MRIRNGYDLLPTSKVVTFETASLHHLKYGEEDVGKTDARHIAELYPYVGKHPIDALQRVKGRDNPLDRYIADRSKKDLCISTVNKAIILVNKIGYLCVNTYGLLDNWTPVKPIALKEGVRLGLRKSKSTQSLTWDEEVVLLKHLPSWLGRMVRFSMLTGCRDQEICNMRWSWLIKTDDMWFFKLPSDYTKTGHERPVVLNSAARAIVESQVGNGSEYVFPSTKGKKLHQMNQIDYQNARRKAGEEIPSILKTNIHSFRDTFSTRLKDQGVSAEDRNVLMGHIGGKMSDLYGEPQMYRMLENSEKAVIKKDGKFMLFSKAVSHNSDTKHVTY